LLIICASPFSTAASRLPAVRHQIYTFYTGRLCYNVSSASSEHILIAAPRSYISLVSQPVLSIAWEEHSPLACPI
jgi:hypothetical protein